MNRALIKDVPIHERPREKALMHGIEHLSNLELLAIIIRSGTRKSSAYDLAQNMISMFHGIEGLLDASPHELMMIPGIKVAKALDIVAAIELGKRLGTNITKTKIKVTSPQIIFDHYSYRYRYEKQENFVVFFLDTKNQIVSFKTVFIGTLNMSVVHPREIFKEAIKNSSNAIICMHNHPSGILTPSKEDIDITSIIYETGQLIGIPLLDHLIIGEEGFFSFKQHELIK